MDYKETITGASMMFEYGRVIALAKERDRLAEIVRELAAETWWGYGYDPPMIEVRKSVKGLIEKARQWAKEQEK